MERIVSVHIEKTAGTSLLKFYRQTLGPIGIYLYNPLKDSIVESQKSVGIDKPITDTLRKVLANTPLYSLAHKLARQKNQLDSNQINIKELPKDLVLVHGHFSANKFDDIIEDSFKTIILRDPLERTISHFLHWKLAKGEMNQRFKLNYTKDCSFEKFVFHPLNQNWQTSYLSEQNLNRFNIVGITEQIDSFAIELLKNISPEKIQDFNNIGRLNTNPVIYNRTTLGIDTEFIERFNEFNKLDIQNYQKACQIVSEYSKRKVPFKLDTQMV